MGIALGIVGTFVLLGGLFGALIATSAVGQIQAAIALLIAAVLLVGGAVVNLLREILKQSAPRAPG